MFFQSVVCVLLAGVSASVSSVPLFMWSPLGYFSGSKCTEQELGIVDAGDVGAALRRLGKAGSQTKGTNALLDTFAKASPANRPEAVVSFFYPQLEKTKAGYASAVQFLEETLGSAKSCVSAPFVEVDSSLSKTLSNSLGLNPRAQVVSYQLGASNCGAILMQIRDNDELFGNDATDLLTLRPQDNSPLDTGCVKRIIELVSAKTKNNVVFTLSADEPVHIITDFPSEAVQSHQFYSTNRGDKKLRSLLEDGEKSPSTRNVATPGALQYISTPILTGLMLGFVLLIFLFIGVGCLMSIDAPQRFATEALPVPKEY
jgi:hypothetical protein